MPGIDCMEVARTTGDNLQMLCYLVRLGIVPSPHTCWVNALPLSYSLGLQIPSYQGIATHELQL